MTGRRAALALGLLCSLACGKKRNTTEARGRGPAVVVIDRQDGVLVPEREPNDEGAQALVLSGEPARAAVRGTIGIASDLDRYDLGVPARGTLRLRLAVAADVDLALDVKDVSGKLLASSDSGPAGVAEGIPNLLITPGTYQLVVREYRKVVKGKAPEPRTVASGEYTLEAAVLPPPLAGEEMEPNDLAAFAGELALGETVSGYLGWRRDRDVWRVKLDGAGEDQALSVDVEALPNVALRVAVLDATEAVLLTRQGKKGEALGLRNVAIRAGESHYFVEITGKKANHEEPYGLRVVALPFQLDEEAEPNDRPETASPLADVPAAEGGVRVGFLGQGDADVFRLEPSPVPRTLHVAMEPPSSVAAELSVVSAAGEIVTTKAGTRGAPVHLDGVAVSSGVSLYIRTAARAGDGDSDHRYRLRWSTIPAEEVTPIPGIDE